MLKVALLQILPSDTREGNLQKGVECCRKAKEAGADIALFPEMWSNGYHVSRDAETLRREATAGDSVFVMTFARLAKELQMAIGVTILEDCDPSARNTLILFDMRGQRVLTYSKVHTCDFDSERNLTPGEDFYVADLDTAKGRVKVGAMICYDREFPESARILMLKGAELILVPNACPMEINRLEQLRSRAFENMIAIATCNYPEGHPDCNGNSTGFDGIAWLPGLPDSRDMCVLNAGPREGVYIAEFDLEKLRGYRAAEVYGNAYRHPDKYHLLIQKEVAEPFIRPDYRG